MVYEPCSIHAHLYHALVDVSLSVLVALFVIRFGGHHEEHSWRQTVDNLAEVVIIAAIAGYSVSMYFCNLGH